MRAHLLLFVLALLVGCDSATPEATWYDAGVSATFDYQAGTVPLQRVDGTPIPDRQRAVVMRFGELNFCPNAVCVGWETPDQQQLASYEFFVGFPLDNETIRASDTGLGVVYPAQCSGSYIQGPRSSVTLTRVPSTPSDVYTLTPCSTYDPPRLALSSRGTETVQTPAGTFEAIVLADDFSVEYWNWEVGLVRYDVMTGDGQLRGRFVRSN